MDAVCHPYYSVAGELWDDGAWFELADGQVQLARSSGTLSWLPVCLGWLTGFHVWVGECRPALILEHESIDPGITDRTLQYGAVLLAASRGDVPRATSLMKEMVASASGRGDGWALTYVDYAKSVLYNGLADYERAAEAAHKAVSANEMAHSSGRSPNWSRRRCAPASRRVPPRRASGCRG